MSAIVIAAPVLTRSAPPTVHIGLRSPGGKMEAPFAGSVQTAEVPFAAYWLMSLVWSKLEEDDAATVQAFGLKLRGFANRAALYHYERPVPRGTINLIGVTVNGAVAQGATSVALSGCGAAKTLKIGDYFGVAGELKMCVATVIADGAGAMAGVTFEPPVRTFGGWANAAPVTLDKPTALFIKQSDTAEWDTSAPIITDVPWDFREVFA